MARISCECRPGEGAKNSETREEDKALDAEGVAGSFLFGLHFHHDLSLAHPALDTSGPLSVCALPNSYGIFLVLWQHIVQESYTYDIDLGCYHGMSICSPDGPEVRPQKQRPGHPLDTPQRGPT